MTSAVVGQTRGSDIASPHVVVGIRYAGGSLFDPAQPDFERNVGLSSQHFTRSGRT